MLIVKHHCLFIPVIIPPTQGIVIRCLPKEEIDGQMLRGGT